MGDAGNVIASEREDGAYFYNKDMRSSTTTVTDGSGNCKAAYEYTDFGETTVNSDFYNDIAYTGGIWDQSTGLYYLNARYYDPDDGRFLTGDTVRPDAENAATWHLYAYCANNLIDYVDPSGHYYSAVRIGYNLYRVSRAAAVAGTIISSGGTLLIVIAVSGVAWYGGSKMAKVITKAVAKKGKRIKSTAKKKKTKKSNKEKANDVPTWVKNYKQKPGENGKHFADRVCNDRYGRNNYKKGPGTEYNRIKKWGDRRG